MSKQILIKSGNQLEFYSYEKLHSNNKQRGNVLRSVGRNRQSLSEQESEALAQTMVRRQDNARRAQVAFRRLCLANFNSSEPAVYVTFTFRPTDAWQQPTLKQGYSLFHIFTVRLRQRYNPDVRYLAVPEFGKRNTQRLHFHALLWGLPMDELKRERETRAFAKIWQYGNVDVVITNNSPKVASYLAKYLAKAYKDPKMFNSRSYVASRNVKRPEIFRDFASFIMEYEFSEAKLVMSHNYETKYLGNCEYKLFELPEGSDQSNIQPT